MLNFSNHASSNIGRLARSWPAVLAVLGVVLMASPAQAQSFKGLQLNKGIGTQDANVLDDLGFGSATAFQTIWVGSLPKLNQLIQTKIAELNPKLPSGVTIYNQKSVLAQNPDVTGSLAGTSIKVKVVLKRNVLFFTLTTPTVFGSYADPRFSLTYDLEFEAEILLPTKTAPLQAKSVKASMTKVSLDSQNFAGDMVKMADAVQAFFTHRDFMAKLTQDQSFDFTPQINAQLGAINANLAGLAGLGYRSLLAKVEPKTHVLKLIAKKAAQLGNGGEMIQVAAGNFEALILEGKDLIPYSAMPGKAWKAGPAITKQATGAGSMAQNSNGNFEVVVLEGSNLVHYWSIPGKAWNRAAVITTKASSSGAIIQSTMGNLEVVVREGSNLVHYWAVPGKPWNRGAVISTKATGAGSIIHGNLGNFEVVVPEGSNLVHYWSTPGKPWNRAAVISTKATGAGSIIHGLNGNFEVVVREGSNLVHYWSIPGKAWNQGAVVSTKATGAGSITQSSSGNFEVVVLEATNFVHIWATPGKAWNRGETISTNAN